MASQGLGSSPILPAPPQPAKGSKGAGAWKQSISQSQAASKQKLAKRKQITAVACQPCQQRKSKCDGLRPACSACLQKKRSDCHYDMNGDQRRTAALKEKIKQLQEHSEDLKEIIRIVCSAADSEEIMTIVKELQQGNFHNTSEALSLLRANTTGLALDVSFRIGQPVDADDEDDVMFSPNSAGWMQASESPVYTTAEAPWTPGENLEQKWPLSPYMGSPSDTFAASSQSLQASSIHTSGRLSIASVNEPPMARNSSQLSDPNQRYLWHRKFEAVTHIRCFANLSQFPAPGESPGTDGSLVPIYSLRSILAVDNDMMSQRFQAFIELKRRMIHEGWSIAQVLGPLNMYPSVNSYTSLADDQNGTSLTVCEWVAKMITWMNIVRQPERMAMMAMGVLFLTWAIVPSAESYQAMPVWMRPTPTQIIMPHPTWIDIIPWPEIRDFFIRFADQSQGMEVLQVFVPNLSINWDLHLADVAVAIPTTNMLALTPSFEAYIRNLDNWSLDPAVLLVYPELAGMARFSPVDALKMDTASTFQ